MARNMRGESEFGLPIMSDPYGNPIPEGASGRAAITAAATDATAIKNGAKGVDATILGDIAQELREVYATDPDRPLGPAATGVGTS